MADLLSRPSAPDESGCIQRITPESAGWEYVGFEVYQLKPGEMLEQETGDKEVCLVLVTGKADIKTNEEEWHELGDRMSVFHQKAPYSVYVPPKDGYRVVATTELELAVCKAPAKGGFPARLISPSDCQYETRGIGTNQRYVCNILFGNFAAEKVAGV